MCALCLSICTGNLDKAGQSGTRITEDGTTDPGRRTRCWGVGGLVNHFLERDCDMDILVCTLLGHGN